MPRPSKAGIPGLRKRHQPGCKYIDRPTRCDCQWFAKYKGIEVSLAKFKGKGVTTKWEAEVALREFKTAVDNGTYTRRRKKGEERNTDDGAQRTPPRTLGELIDRYVEHAEDEGGYAEGSGHAAMIERIKREIGERTLEKLDADAITRWLRQQAKGRKWGAKTWEYHRSTLGSFFKFAKDREWIAKNPITLVPEKTPPKPKEPERLTEQEERRLLAACDRLDDPERRATRAKITQAQAKEIRVRVKAGEPADSLAREFGVSYSTVRLIAQGKIWNLFTRGTKGKEMRRRVLFAFRTGARAGEMLRITPEMIDTSNPDCYVVTLPPVVTKGGKTTGETEYLYIIDPELKTEVLSRLEALKDNPEHRRYVFGKETGARVKSVSWEKLFDLAGIPRGRGKGFVWHTLRHEAISRFADHSGDNPYDVQRLARHRDIRTTMKYVHRHRERLIELARKAQGGTS